MSNDRNRYYLVKLVKGPAWQPGISLGLIVLQFKHMHNLWRLQREKKIVLAGPLSNEGEIRGIAIFKVDTEEEVLGISKGFSRLSSLTCSPGNLAIP